MAFFKRPQPNFNEDNENNGSYTPEETNEASPLSQAENEIKQELQNPQNTMSVEDFFSDDEEELALVKAKEQKAEGKDAGGFSDYGDGSVEKDIDNNIARLRKEYPMGGIKASRFITTDILMKAPEDFFTRYEDTVKDIVSKVQTSLADSQKSDIVSEASGDPTNEDLQDAAYRTVHALAVSYLDKLHFRGAAKAIILSMVSNEIIGFGPLDPLWRDSRVTEILANGPFDIQIEIKGQLYKVNSCKFRDAPHLEGLLERLFGSISKRLSRTTPLLNGRLHDKSRIYAVDRVSAPAGPNFSIRRHSDEYISPDKYLQWGACNQEMLVELGNLIYKGASFLASGGTGTGKTTLLNALSAYFPPTARVLTLEDNLEMKLHPKKFLAAAMETVPAKPGDKNDYGVTMRDLVKGSLRLRPDGIIVGEVRDEAAYDLCQALNTGHWGASTVHANNEFDAIYRLVSLVSQGGLMGGNSAYPLIAAAFDIIIQLKRFPEDGSRRIVSISEVAPYPVYNEVSRNMELPTNVLWTFVHDGLEDGKVVGHWEKRGELSETRRNSLMLDTMKPLTWDQLRSLAKL